MSSSQTLPIKEPASLKIIGIGEQRLFVEVQATCRLGFQVKSINFRCIKLIDIGTGTPVRSVVPITRIRDPINADKVRMLDDGFNGIDAEYSDSRGLGRNRCLYFELVISPSVEWAGCLSFKARDSSGFCSYARYAIEVRNFAAPADDELLEEHFQSGFDD